MKRLFNVIIFAVLTMTAAFAEKPKAIDKFVSVNPFSQIVLKGSTKVYFIQGDTTLVRIHGLEKGIDNIVVEQIDGVLYISNKGTNVSSFGDLFQALKKQSIDETIAIYITSPVLTSISLTGSGDFKMKGMLNTDNLQIILNGSGDVELANVVCDNIVADMQGSGDIEIKRVECVTSKLNLHGSGDIEFKQHKARKTDISLQGSGDVKVRCYDCDEVNASLMGSGDIKLEGNIKTLNRVAKGSGDVKFRGY